MTPFKEGYLARCEGKRLSENQYDDDRRIGWRQGWRKADRTLDETVRESAQRNNQPQGRPGWGRPTELHGNRHSAQTGE